MSKSGFPPNRFGTSTNNDDSVLNDDSFGEIDGTDVTLGDVDADIVTGRNPSASGDKAASSGGMGGATQKGQEALSTAKDKASDVSGQAKDKASTAKDKASDVSGQAKDKASEVSGQAHAKADDGLNKAAGGVSQAADKLRQHGEQSSGSMSTAATTAADKLDSAGEYLREKDTDQLLQDLEALIRRKPVESLLVAAGTGFVLSKLFS